MIQAVAAEVLRMEGVMRSARQPLLISGLQVRVLPGSPLIFKDLNALLAIADFAGWLLALPDLIPLHRCSALLPSRSGPEWPEPFSNYQPPNIAPAPVDAVLNLDDNVPFSPR
jgi:hypothetical protein